MPQVFKIGSYWVYFWANENEPSQLLSYELLPHRQLSLTSNTLISEKNIIT